MTDAIVERWLSCQRHVEHRITERKKEQGWLKSVLEILRNLITLSVVYEENKMNEGKNWLKFFVIYQI